MTYLPLFSIFIDRLFWSVGYIGSKMVVVLMTFQAHQSNRVCNALALLQCVASHPETRSAFLQGKVTHNLIIDCRGRLIQNEWSFVALVDVLMFIISFWKGVFVCRVLVHNHWPIFVLNFYYTIFKVKSQYEVPDFICFNIASTKWAKTPKNCGIMASNSRSRRQH